LRGCALVRPHQPGTLGSGGGPDSDAKRAANCNLPPGIRAGWIGQPHVTPLSLNRLTPCEVGAIVDHIVGNQSLPANIRQDIIERTDGIPLFVEETTKAVLEAES